MIELSIIFSLMIYTLLLSGLYSLISVSVNLQYAFARVINLAHGEFMMIGAYLTYWFVTLYSINPLILTPAIGLIFLAIGMLLHICVFRSILKRCKSTETFVQNTILVSFGLSFLLQNLAIILWSSSPRTYKYFIGYVQIFLTTIPVNRLVTFFTAIFICLFFFLFVKRTLTGKAMMALMQNIKGAASLGINISRLHVISFSLGLAMAGITGSLISLLFTLSPTMGLPFTCLAFLIVILGGLGNMTSGIFASLIVAALEVFSGYLLGPGPTTLLEFLLFVAILLFRPQGLGKGIE